MQWYGLFFVAAGIFSMAGAILNWNWFFNSRKAAFMVNMIGRTGARIFYGLLGAAIAVFGGLSLMGIIDLTTRR